MYRNQPVKVSAYFVVVHKKILKMYSDKMDMYSF